MGPGHSVVAVNNVEREHPIVSDTVVPREAGGCTLWPS